MPDRDPRFNPRTGDGLRGAKKPRRVFVNSMSDTFHADAPPESLSDLARHIRSYEAGRAHSANGLPAVQRAAGRPDHVIMLLTKRPNRMRSWQREQFPGGLPSWVWVGTTVEDQQRADERVPPLLKVETNGVRFLSCEPLVGPVDLCRVNEWDDFSTDALDTPDPSCRVGWVIAGGESGRGARPMHPGWVRSLRDQCSDAGIPFHFKQWGAWAPAEGWGVDTDAWVSPNGRILGRWIDGDVEPYPGAALMRRVGKHAAGRLLDGRTWDEVPGA